MSFYIRYVMTDDRTVSLEELDAALQQIEQSYAIEGDLILYRDSEYGLIDITYRGNPICDGDLELLWRLAERKRHREAIHAMVRNATGLVCVQPLDSLDERTVEVLAPLWEWLLANRAGFIAWEGGHFFGRTGELT